MDIEGILAIILLFGGGTAVALGYSPVGRAVADRIRGKHGLRDMDAVRADLDERHDAMADEVRQLREEVTDLAERLDFAERLLAQRQDAQRLSGGAPG